jgi:hypothetical protein
VVRSTAERLSLLPLVVNLAVNGTSTGKGFFDAGFLSAAADDFAVHVITHPPVQGGLKLMDDQLLWIVGDRGDV